MSAPLDLPPEILSIIASLLPKKSLLACIQVSGSWNRTLLPSLWQEINLQNYYDFEGLSLIDKAQDQLNNHADMVRALAINIYPEFMYFHCLNNYHFRHLQTLNLHIEVIDSVYHDSAVLTRDFIQRHSNQLKSISVLVVYGDPAMPLMSAWNLLSGCLRSESRLTSLDLTLVRLDLNKMDELTRLMLLGLRTLKLSLVVFTAESHSTVPPHGPLQWSNRLTGCKVQHLRLIDCDTVDEAYQLLDDCREIKSLEFGWDFAVSLEKAPWMISQLQAGVWPFLESLNLDLRLEDLELAQIMEAINPLRHLVMDRSAFGTLSSISLLETGGGKHLRMLETLSLSGCSELEGRMVQRVLCEMPSLKVLRANLLTAQDIERDPRPWACTGIEEISIAFVLQTNNVPTTTNTLEETLQQWRQDEIASMIPLSASKIFLRRLATLTRLRILDLREALPSRANDRPQNVRYHYMKMTLDCELDLLRTLHRLKELVSPTCHGMGPVEAQWMIDHWPYFTTICLNQRHPERESLFSFFELCGVKQIRHIGTRDEWMEHEVFPRPQ